MNYKKKSVLFLLLLFSANTYATAILISSSTYNLPGYHGYGGIYYSQYTSLLDSAATVNTTFELNDLSLMQDHDGIIIEFRNKDDVLSNIELSNLSAYVASGKKLVMIGENHLWSTWNRSILGLSGGMFSGETTGFYEYSQIVSNHSLVNGVSSLYIRSGGKALGGEALDENNVATLWSDNILTILDTNIWEDGQYFTRDNDIFAANVVNWMVPVKVPEPSILALLSAGFGVILFRRRT